MLAAELRAAKAAQGKAALRTVLGRWLPERLARHLEEAAGVTGTMAELSGAVLDRVAAGLRDWRLVPVGSEGYRTAEVTLGGVDTRGAGRAHDGGAGRAGPLLRGRGGGCDRLAGRLQLPVGLVERLGGGAGAVGCPLPQATNFRRKFAARG